MDADAALLKHIYDTWEKSQNVIRVFCDLSKVFDYVDNESVLLKLYYYGIQDAVLDLVAS